MKMDKKQPDDLLSLIGESQENTDITTLLNQEHKKLTQPKFYVTSKFLEDLTLNFRVDFDFNETYKNIKRFEHYIEPPFEGDNDFYWILEGINFHKNLPFGLNLNSSQADVKKTCVPYEKHSNTLWYATKEKWQLIIRFENNTVASIEVMALCPILEKNLETLANLKTQNSQINSLCADKILAYDKKRPTVFWRKQMNELSEISPDFYCDKNLNKMDGYFDTFIKKIIKHNAKQNALAIYKSAKYFVEQLNRLERDYGYIESEGDELVTYILDVVELTGVRLNFDFTENWRIW